MTLDTCFHPRWRSAARCATAKLAAIAAVVAALAVAGCGQGKGDGMAVHPAEGQILWKGKPLGGALVVLHPQGQSDGKQVAARGRTDADGRFRVGTFDSADGAVEGEYAVTVTYCPIVQQEGGGWSPGPNVLPPKYANPKTSELRVQVVKGANTLPALLLSGPESPKGRS